MHGLQDSCLSFATLGVHEHDPRMRRIPQFFLLGAMFMPSGSQGESANEALARATAAVQAAAPRAQTDAARPIFHLTAPAQWINDPNGPIFHKGYYHLFYQLHPFSDQDGTKYWGHVRSRDLVKWEHLPIALAPSNDKGEEAIWSGSCTINGNGQPMIFYTSIALGKSAFDHAEQWAAIGDDDLIHWKKSPANPVLSEALHGERKIYDWRDPFVFHDRQKGFLVTGGHLAKDGHAAVNIYEAEDPALTHWKYRGVLFQIPDAPTAECPNFFKLGDHWVLLVSPYGKVQYFVGDFNSDTCRFTPRTHGLVDYGPNFYAPNTMLLPDGGRLVWGWINGFPSGRGWNGCLSLPRRLSISQNGELRQVPASELTKLRGKPVVWRNIHSETAGQALQLPQTNTLEILAEINLEKAKAVELEFNNGDSDTKPLVVNFDGSQLTVMDIKAPCLPEGGARKLRLRMFVDRSVLEVLANDTVWITKTIPPLDAHATLSVRSGGGAANFKLLQVWPMKTIW
jgi:beta-fructofuranosidase